ncbi:thioesterase II family protein [Streptomyces venezuelae]
MLSSEQGAALSPPEQAATVLQPERLNPWFSAVCDGRPRLRLCCLPYAGGTGAVFKDWPAALPPGIQLLTAHLPGRGDRFAEPPPHTLEETAEHLCAALPPADVPTAPRVSVQFLRLRRRVLSGSGGGTRGRPARAARG